MTKSKSYHMTPNQFRHYGRAVVDWIADYYEQIESFPVLSQVEPGEIRAGLPPEPPLEGEPYLKRLEELAPGSLTACLVRGISLGKQGQPSKALPYFKKVVEMNPCGSTYSSLGYNYFLMKDYKRAEEAYKKGQDFRDSKGNLYFNFATLYEAMGDPKKALKFLNLSIQNGCQDNVGFRNRLTKQLQEKAAGR